MRIYKIQILLFSYFLKSETVRVAKDFSREIRGGGTKKIENHCPRQFVGSVSIDGGAISTTQHNVYAYTYNVYV